MDLMYRIWWCRNNTPLKKEFVSGSYLGPLYRFLSQTAEAPYNRDKFKIALSNLRQSAFDDGMWHFDEYLEQSDESLSQLNANLNTAKENQITILWSYLQQNISDPSAPPMTRQQAIKNELNPAPRS